MPETKSQPNFFHSRKKSAKTYNMPSKPKKSFYSKDGRVEKNSLLDVDLTSQQATRRKIGGM